MAERLACYRALIRLETEVTPRRTKPGARSRSLKLSTAIKVLLDERLQELEADDRLTPAEEWQRVQVRASWEQFRTGKNPEVRWEEIANLFDEALGRSIAPLGRGAALQ